LAELEKKNLKLFLVQTSIFQPPAVPGYGAAGGFELRLLDKTGSGDYKRWRRLIMILSKTQQTQRII
jgi:HAE1 family hydrophobic/amphiphilic exporter-1